MKTRSTTALLLVILSLSGCATPEKSVRVCGGDVAVTGLIAPVKETFEEENGIPLVVVPSVPGTGLPLLLNGSVDAIVSAEPVDDLVKEAARENVVVDRKALREVQVGKNRTVVFLNKGIKVRKLAKKQLKDIFTGRITNWKKVGGPNRHIVVVWNPGATGENEPFVREVLRGEPVVATFRPAASAEEVRNKVLETPGAIGIGPNVLVAAGVRVPQSPALVSTLLIITRDDPSPKTQKLIELIKDVEFLP